MELRIFLAGSGDGSADPSDGEGLRDLYGWVAQDQELRLAARLSLEHAPPRPGEMGAGLDAILAVANTSSAGLAALSAFAQTLLTWWATRRRTDPVTVEVGGASFAFEHDGRRVEVTAPTTEEAVTLMREGRKMLTGLGFAARDR